MYDRSTKILSVFTAVFLFLFLTELFPIAGKMAFMEGANHTKEETYNGESENDEIDRKVAREWREGAMREAASEPRIIEEEILIRKRIPNLSKEDFSVLCRIVQAEAGGEDMLGKQMVADVIINRVCSRRFPNSVSGVVFQQSGGKAQFSPIRDGRYYSVKVTADTKEAVTKALEGSDCTSGALYFVNASKANPGNLSWFENCLTFQVEHGGHRFYK